MSSQPSEVTIGQNAPPTASAGIDQLVIVNTVVTLTGATDDADGDTVTSTWSFSVKPNGSGASLASPSHLVTTFVPDLPGTYVVQLAVSDYVQMLNHAAAAFVGGLPPGDVTTRGNQNALIQFLTNASVAMGAGNFQGARQQLEQAMSRVDGCMLRSGPDGNGPGRDWVTNCVAQAEIYPLLADALSAIPQ